MPVCNPPGRPNTIQLCCFLNHKCSSAPERETDQAREGERLEVGGGVEMNGSGGFIGCCQGG